MLTRRTPMRRTGFKRPQRPPRQVTAAQAITHQYRPAVRMAAGLDLAAPVVIEKENPLRDEDYRRLVAGLPCCACGIEGHSQCAHENEGKGKALKVDDRRSFALCTVGAKDCHAAFDQYRLISGGRNAHAELGRLWTARTHLILRALAEHDRAVRRIVERTIGL